MLDRLREDPEFLQRQKGVARFLPGVGVGFLGGCFTRLPLAFSPYMKVFVEKDL
jgi:hypothetical protein